MSFMHGHNVAHRDCTDLNIMMDGAALYPDGFHPIRMNYSRDGVFKVEPLPRIDNSVRYYFIDFGMSTKFATGASPYVVGAKGRDQDVPELSRDVPYNAYEVDIYTLGNLYRKEFFEKYQGMDFLIPLIDAMTEEEPDHRPSATVALPLFRRIHNNLDSELIRLRLRPRYETVSERIVRDTCGRKRGDQHAEAVCRAIKVVTNYI
ncbi:hypothetical protein SERLADRAFT_462397 [Serpula lacrymans var. lacrymans S7.9]|uniref:Protein kinase domain-containing protein n=1 Tax=Serpula lacrymans var. lacrymans (strain S7.9) TaxID=578457 RepID=F8NN83_SERL9|nr:uncharacterized protein SERLADRAFT_462397 [Serpula lacrymans var. lacrymans S7.9]EGO28004.1 hypothetical protein SERLADRAFT_462397 [Serpula lacrymans var. lacrymans S7.9]